MNRVGDMGLSIGFFAMFALFGSLDYATIFSIAPFVNETAITIIALLLLSGAMAKSAQIPLHSWLPGSMEGPNFIGKPVDNFVSFLLYFLFLYLFYYFYFYTKGLIEENLIDPGYNLMMVLPVHLGRDEKGRFIKKLVPLVQLPEQLKEALFGDLLGDGHLRCTHKDKDGNYTGNCHYAMTLKIYNYSFYL
jgi:hypothetical protein